MKRFLMAAIAVLIASGPVFAQSSRDIRMARKEAKVTAKQLKRQGFKLLELGDLQSQLEKYLLKVQAGTEQIVGTADGCTTINIAKTMALNNAINEYASKAGGTVRGRITSELSSVNGVQTDNLIAGFERALHKELRGEVKTAITLVKQSKKSVDARVYCLIDYDDVHNAKMRAMENALEEQGTIQEYGSRISDWVKASEE